MTDTNQNLKKYPMLTAALIAVILVPQLGLGMSTPANPDIARYLHVSVSSVQNTMVLYMLGYALSMLFSGFLSDRLGPRKVQILGLALSCAATFVAAFTHDIFIFGLARFAQAFGGCVSTVTTRLIVREEFPEKDHMKILTTLASVFAIGPCITPLLGGYLLPYIGWRGLFILIAVIVFSIYIMFWFSTTKLKHHIRGAASFREIGVIYLACMKSSDFRLYAGCISLVWMSYFVFISCSSYPIQIGSGVSPFFYGALLSIAASGYVAGSTSARFMADKIDIDTIILIGTFMGGIGGMTIVLATWLAPSAFVSIAAPMILVLFSVGMIIPASQAGLLKSSGKNPGIASGLFFFIEMLAGAIYAGIGNRWHEMTTQGLAALVALPCFVLPIYFYLGKRTRRKQRVLFTG